MQYILSRRYGCHPVDSETKTTITDSFGRKWRKVDDGSLKEVGFEPIRYGESSSTAKLLDQAGYELHMRQQDVNRECKELREEISMGIKDIKKLSILRSIAEMVRSNKTP